MKNSLISPNGTPSSSFCFGTMQFGEGADELQSQAMFEAARAADITFFDTAFAYTDGASETLLGHFAKAERDTLIIATKCDFSAPHTADNINRSFDASRSRLDMDFIDVFYLHRWDSDTPLNVTFEALATLQQAGKIGVIGVSNFSAWQVMKAQAAAEKFSTRINILQPMYNLVKRQVEVEILPMAVSEDLNVAPYSPLGGGLLTGKYVDGKAGRITSNKMYATRYGPEWMHQTATDLSTIAKRENVNPATLAVAWAAINPAVSSPIISARTVAQLQPSLDALTYQMSTELYAELTALSPTPPPATDRLDDL